MRWLKVNGLHILIQAAALFPAVWIVWRFSQGNLTANPVREIQLETGRTALTLLLLSLACSPVYHLSGFNQVRQWRRTLGLYAFVYVVLHLVNFIALDYSFNFRQILDAVVNKLFPLAGVASFLFLIPAAVTSTKRCMERLGKNWQRLHRLVYIAAAMGVFHYLWAAKSQADFVMPIIYMAALALLLTIRIPSIRRAISRRGV